MPSPAPLSIASTPRAAALFVVVAGTAFATSGPLARWARPADPIAVAFGRVALAALVLGALDVRGVARSLLAASPRHRGLVVLAGALLALHFGLFLRGLDGTSLPAAVSLVSLEPLSVVLVAWAFFGVRPSRGEAVGVGLATIGAVIVASGAGTGDHRLAGDLMVLASVSLYGLYVGVARGLGFAFPARHYAALVYGVAAIALGLYLVVAPGGGGASLLALSPRSMLAIALLALVPTVLGHTAVQVAARSLPPTIVALASPAETIGGIAIGAVALAAIPSSLELAGALVVVCGSALTIIAGARRPG